MIFLLRMVEESGAGGLPGSMPNQRSAPVKSQPRYCSTKSNLSPCAPHRKQLKPFASSLENAVPFEPSQSGQAARPRRSGLSANCKKTSSQLGKAFGSIIVAPSPESSDLMSWLFPRTNPVAAHVRVQVAFIEINLFAAGFVMRDLLFAGQVVEVRPADSEVISASRQVECIAGRLLNTLEFVLDPLQASENLVCHIALLHTNANMTNENKFVGSLKGSLFPAFGNALKRLVAGDAPLEKQLFEIVCLVRLSIPSDEMPYNHLMDGIFGTSLDVMPIAQGCHEIHEVRIAFPRFPVCPYGDRRGALVPSPAPGRDRAFPHRIAATGCFSSTPDRLFSVRSTGRCYRVFYCRLLFPRPLPPSSDGIRSTAALFFSSTILAYICVEVRSR